jgi:bidirectional [NiFe] hydrogenase diaphorase subunit
MKTISVTIDGKKIQVEDDKTVLQAAKEAGISIPTICHDDQLHPYGACRLCMVEVETNGRKKLVASCCYPVQDGLIVRTTTEQVEHIRKILLELLLAGCPSGSQVSLAKKYGVVESRFTLEQPQEAPCNLCGLCVRYCNEISKHNAVCFVGRGINKTVALVPGVSDICVSCRKCLDLCDAGKMVYLIDEIQEISCPPLKTFSPKKR